VTDCTQPDCHGELESGYCNVCGLRTTDGGGVAADIRPSVTPASVAVNRSLIPCGQPGCDGTLAPEGFCTVCGLAPPGGSRATPAVSAPVDAAIPASGGSVTNGSAGSRGTSTVRRPSGTSGTTARLTGITAAGGSRGNLGAGMVEMPPVPERDPQAAVLDDPEVQERKRFCGRCNHPVGRARGARPARTEGFCPHCGAAYSFTPKLFAGDLVGGQYLVAGCIAHGGLGWIYLAQDMNLDGSWVVLKGLLDSGDESAMAVALAEKRFLTEVRHPNIVRIYNFVQHEGAGYIVMEYIGGLSLRDLRVQLREETGEPLSVQQAIGYVLGILPALEYLHGRGLLFCDFKPDNVIHREDQLTLIDLGGVRRMDDDVSDLYGTVGYQAPEIAEHHASVASDLYTVARTLAVLSIEFPGYQDEKRYATKLPPIQEVPVFRRYESFHRFLQKATAPEPAARFQTAGEMAEQLFGVLCQVVARDGGTPRANPSMLFSAELGASPDGNPWQFLPVPAIDPADAAAGVLATAALLGADQRKALLEATPRTPELSLAVARFSMDDGEFDVAARELESQEARESGWRAAWWRGVLHLADDRPADALPYFSAVAAELPGEVAPKLAMATCFEEEAQSRGPQSDDVEGVQQQRNYAVRDYSLVAATDPTCASASFGLARMYLALGHRDDTVAALRRIPKSSSAYVTAQIALCKVQCARIQDEMPDWEELAAASQTLDALSLENSVRLPLVRELHLQALNRLLDGADPADDELLLAGAALSEEGQRSALEGTYRSLAKLAATQEERWALVDQANHYRPRTFT
jgi:serine/threonine-protein kinase PknG